MGLCATGKKKGKILKNLPPAKTEAVLAIFQSMEISLLNFAQKMKMIWKNTWIMILQCCSLMTLQFPSGPEQCTSQTELFFRHNFSFKTTCKTAMTNRKACHVVTRLVMHSYATSLAVTWQVMRIVLHHCVTVARLEDPAINHDTLIFKPNNRSSAEDLHRTSCNQSGYRQVFEHALKPLWPNLVVRLPRTIQTCRKTFLQFLVISIPSRL